MDVDGIQKLRYDLPLPINCNCDPIALTPNHGGTKTSVCVHVYRFLNEVRPSAWKSSFLRVGVHVRVSDLLIRSAFVGGYTVPGASYFIKAAKYLTANVTTPVQFIVTTDNLNWTKKHIALETIYRNCSNTSVVYSEGKSAGFDMALLASCDALIMSTGTYGWWAAWLANKPTVYYRYWPRPGSHIFAKCNHADFFPPQWIGLGNESDLAFRRKTVLKKKNMDCVTEIYNVTKGAQRAQTFAERQHNR